MVNGIIIVDHGSRRSQSNELLEAVAALFGKRFAEEFTIVEPAHMEIAEPSIAGAYAKCVERGATRIVVCPFFLGPGKHWTTDIPQLTAQAAAHHPGTRYHVTMPLGIDDLIVQLLHKRASFCQDKEFTCESCEGTMRCGENPVAVDAGATDHPPANAQCSTCPFVAQADGTIIDKRKTVAVG